ncbi:MAG: SDR family oxidoreductase, partial [Bacteroidetes bacterium]|nr:SDR family oxidoreductase [Bacteroidota bacterium]
MARSLPLFKQFTGMTEFCTFSRGKDLNALRHYHINPDNMDINIDFSGKNVLVTGGSRGIGKACALLFAQLNAGVIITYRANHSEAERTLEEMGTNGNHKALQLDVADAEAIAKLFGKLKDIYGRIDIVVNNAGEFSEHRIADIGYDEWQARWNRTIAVNLTGAANVCYMAARHMIEKGGGKIVNISSRGAFRGEPNHPAYGASKAGLNSMSQSLAQYLAPYNITVGVVAPGFTETDMAAEVLNSPAGEGIKRQSPLNRVAQP